MATGYDGLRHADSQKVAKYGPICNALGREFLPLGFTLWGEMSSGTHKFLAKVADAAHEYGYVGEAWGALKGDRIRAMHRLFQGPSYVLNKNVAMQLVDAQNVALSAFIRDPRHARRGQSGRAPTGGWGWTPGAAGHGRGRGRGTGGAGRMLFPDAGAPRSPPAEGAAYAAPSPVV